MRLARRATPLRGGQPRAFAVGFIVALLLGAVLLIASGFNPLEVYAKMFDTSLGSLAAISKTLTRAVPLGLAGLAVAVAGSMGLWNIGAEGQIIAGAIGAAWMARLGPDLPGPVLIPLMLLAGILGGALLAFGPGVARSRLGVNEIITTLMLNEVALRAVRYLLNGPWKDPDGNNFPMAPRLPEQSELPTLFERANVGLVIAVAVVALFGIFASRSAWGYELRVAGSSAKAAEYVGISLRRKILTVLVLSGGIAGLAGGLELAGSAERLNENIAGPGFGFAGIIVAALALMRPSGVAAVAVAFGAVQVGGIGIRTTGVPGSIANVLQALILLGALTAAVLSSYEVVRGGRAAPAADASAPVDGAAAV